MPGFFEGFLTFGQAACGLHSLSAHAQTRLFVICAWQRGLAAACFAVPLCFINTGC